MKMKGIPFIRLQSGTSAIDASGRKTFGSFRKDGSFTMRYIFVFIFLNMLVVSSFAEEPAKPDNSNKGDALQESLSSSSIYSKEWFRQKEEEYSAARTNQVDLIRYAVETEKLADECQDPAPKARLLGLAGSAYRAAATDKDGFDKAKEIFTQAIKLDADDGVTLSCMRQLADLETAFQNTPAALALLEEMERRLTSETNSMHPGRKEMYLQHIYPKLAGAKKRMGQIDESIAIREKTLDMLGDRDRAEMMLENARQFSANKEYERAVQGYARLFKEYPDFGREDGRVVYILMEEIGAHGYTNSVDIVPLLIEIWEDPRNRDYLSVFYAGHHLINHLNRMEDERIYKYGDELNARIKEAMKTNSLEDIKKYNLELFQAQALQYMAMLAAHNKGVRRPDAKERLQEYIETSPTGSGIQQVAETYAELEREEKEAEALKMRQWRTRFFAFLIVVVAFIPVYFLSKSRGGGNPV